MVHAHNSIKCKSELIHVKLETLVSQNSITSTNLYANFLYVKTQNDINKVMYNTNPTKAIK